MPASPVDGRSPRVLVLSQRRLNNRAANAALYDFEDLLGEIDDVEIIAPTRPPRRAGQVYRLARRLRAPQALARQIACRPYEFAPDRDYDLFLAVLDGYRQVASVHAVRDLRERCRRAICFLPEIWPRDYEQGNEILELFTIFDHVFIGVAHPVEHLARIIGRPCTNLHPAVDTVRGCPAPHIPRSIDICNLGRRSAVTHRALLDHADANDLFYYYDTGAGVLRIEDHRNHRRLLSDLLKRTRYFIANHAKIDRPDQTSGVQEVGYRFFEGAAGGTVMLGRAPDTVAFKRLFGWPDAVIPCDFDNPAIADLLRELDRDPERVARIRASNVAHALREHDWLYRYEAMLAAVGLPGTARMAARRQRLAARASEFEGEMSPALQQVS